MFVICKDKTIDLSKFETIRFRESLLGDGYPVEAIRHEVGFWGTTVIVEEIARMTCEGGAFTLVSDITNAMIAKEAVFRLDDWEKRVKEEANKGKE